MARKANSDGWIEKAADQLDRDLALVHEALVVDTPDDGHAVARPFSNLLGRNARMSHTERRAYQSLAVAGQRPSLFCGREHSLQRLAQMPRVGVTTPAAAATCWGTIRRLGYAKRDANNVDHRAEFSAVTRKIIAERAGYQCSVLNCGRLTVGPGPAQKQVVNIGMAAHIYAASPGGPRGTGGLSAAERSEPENGIWCCFSHGKAIDSDGGHAFSAAQLKTWKRLHEARKGAEVNGAPQDHCGLVESIAVNSAPASLAGREFELGMRNIISGPIASGNRC